MFYDLTMFFLNFFLLIIFILISVAFLTLFERSLLGYIHIRKGPNKVGYFGVSQPFSDALKLISKEQTYPILSNYFIYYFSPIFSFMISLIIWSVFPYLTYLCSFMYGFLFFLCCISLNVYSTMIAGWSSNSNYSLIGSLRSVAQTISYEVSLALISLSLIFLVGGFSMFNFMNYQYYCWFVSVCFPLMICFFASCLAETIRTPFNFAEGESDLVSGFNFNVEYGAGGFTLIFLPSMPELFLWEYLWDYFSLEEILLIDILYKIIFCFFLFYLSPWNFTSILMWKVDMFSLKEFTSFIFKFFNFFCGLKILLTSII
uniref:NADH-ubiquinone oxidoreductase chain 1 n=1 Tax=Mekongiana xiangchengensis TaxID=868576 RepID=E1ABT6_9ORTH|nr:NADH dehydrogenase subunit 1 [Mekongiana xiangchengensis]ADK77635.1 NADH dehydrogenase subunit 1 [Mekongiana xiangchengensis]